MTINEAMTDKVTDPWAGTGAKVKPKELFDWRLILIHGQLIMTIFAFPRL